MVKCRKTILPLEPVHKELLQTQYTELEDSRRILPLQGGEPGTTHSVGAARCSYLLAELLRGSPRGQPVGCAATAGQSLLHPGVLPCLRPFAALPQ